MYANFHWCVSQDKGVRIFSLLKVGNERSRRQFHADWLSAIEWLAHIKKRKKVSCSVRISIPSQNWTFSFIYGKYYRNFRKGQDNIERHEGSNTHKASVCNEKFWNNSCHDYKSLLILKPDSKEAWCSLPTSHFKDTLCQSVLIRGDADEQHSHIFQ